MCVNVDGESSAGESSSVNCVIFVYLTISICVYREVLACSWLFHATVLLLSM